MGRYSRYRLNFNWSILVLAALILGVTVYEIVKQIMSCGFCI